MDEQPAFGIDGTPSVFPRQVFQKGQRSTLFVTEQQESKSLLEPLLKPLDFWSESLMLRVGQAPDAAIREVFRSDLFQKGFGGGFLINLNYLPPMLVNT